MVILNEVDFRQTIEIQFREEIALLRPTKTPKQCSTDIANLADLDDFDDNSSVPTSYFDDEW